MGRSQPRMFRSVIGHRLREHRQALDLTQEQLAWEIGVAQGSISHYEQGKSEIPLGVLLDICDALHVSALDIVPELAAPTYAEDTARAS